MVTVEVAEDHAARVGIVESRGDSHFGEEPGARADQDGKLERLARAGVAEVVEHDEIGDEVPIEVAHDDLLHLVRR